MKRITHKLYFNACKVIFENDFMLIVYVGSIIGAVSPGREVWK